MLFFALEAGHGRHSGRVYSTSVNGSQEKLRLGALGGEAVARGGCWGGWRRSWGFV